MTLDDVKHALGTGNDLEIDDAVSGLGPTPSMLVEAIDLVLTSLRARAADDEAIMGWQFKLAGALEQMADSAVDVDVAASAARRAAVLHRDVLNDGEGTTRALVQALRLSTESDVGLRSAVDLAGGPDPAQVLVEKAIKRARGDDELLGRLRRCLARMFEIVLHDKERAFFEGLKAARKLASDGLVVDDVYRLALETNRIEEAAAFFQSLADEGTIGARTRATAFNKLGALLEHKGDRAGAFAAYVGSLHHHETKAARKKAERLKDDLEVSTPLPAPVESEPTLPPMRLPIPAAVVDVEPPPLLLVRDEHTGPGVAVVADPDADTRLGERAVAGAASDGGFASDDAAPFMAHLDHAGTPSLVGGEPPPLPDDEDDDDDDGDVHAVDDDAVDAVDAEADVDDALLSDEELEQSVAVQRYVPEDDHTVERDALETRTLPPAMETALAAPDAIDGLSRAVPRPPIGDGIQLDDNDDDVDDDVEEDGPPSFLAPPVAHTAVSEVPFFTALQSMPAPAGDDDDDDAPMPPPSDEVVAVVADNDGADGLAALFRTPTPRRGHDGLVEETGPGRTVDVTLPAGDVEVSDDVDEHDDEHDDGAMSPPLLSSADGEPVVEPVLEPLFGDVLAPPAFTMPATGLVVDEQSEREAAIERATLLLAADDDAHDVDVLVDAAERLQKAVPGDPRTLRLAARALLVGARAGLPLSTTAIDLVVADAFRHGDRAVKAIAAVHTALPVDERAAYAALWLAGAHAAGHDVDAVHALLEGIAADDAPDGAAFTYLDAALREAGDVDRRDVLHLRAWRLAEKAGDVERQTTLLRRRIALLQEARRDGAAVQAWTQLVLEHTTDRATRDEARRFLADKAGGDERARLLARLVRKLDRVVDADEGLDVSRELLRLRVELDDRMGAEATARDLLQRAPDDDDAAGVLIDLLAGDTRRAAELVELLRVRADTARSRGAAPVAAEALEQLARVELSLGHDDDAARSFIDAARLVPGDTTTTTRIVDALTQAERHADVVDLLEGLADDAPTSTATRLLVRAAEIARTTLKRIGRARELLEHAVAVDGTDAAALEALATLLLSIGDTAAAVVALDKVVAVDGDRRARAATQLRIGTLLEEHVHDDDGAAARFRAAVDDDRTLQPAWDALLRIARRRGDNDTVVFAMTGLAALAAGHERAATFNKLGRLQLVEQKDAHAAGASFAAALDADAADVDAVLGFVEARAAIHGNDAAFDVVVAEPPAALLVDVRDRLLQAERAGATLPVVPRRLLAMAVVDSDDVDAGLRFEALLETDDGDLPTLRAFAALLERRATAAPSSLAAVAADDRRRRLLETLVAQHASALSTAAHVCVIGDLTALRLSNRDTDGARAAARKALALVAANDGGADHLTDRAVRAFVLVFDDDNADAADADHLDAALRLDLQRAKAPAEKARLKERQAAIVMRRKNDVVAARQLLQEALEHEPGRSSARERLFELELAGEDPRDVVRKSRALLDSEADPTRRALLHLKLFGLLRRGRTGTTDGADDIKSAIELAPGHPDVLAAAEAFYAERRDARGLEELLSARLRVVDRADVVARVALLERLATLRRFERHDPRGAIDALEAINALDVDAIKPREDVARLYAEVRQYKDAAVAFRGVIERETLHIDAWRGLLLTHARARQADEAFAVAVAMVALEIADDDVVRAVRAVRPPFPRWPITPGDAASVARRLGHPLERTPVRAVLEIVAPRLLPRLGRPLDDFGVRRRDALADGRLPASVVAGVRAASALAGFKQPMPLWLADVDAANGPPFMALPAREPGLSVSPDVVKNGMTPERAVALGRALAWLSPAALLASSLDTSELRGLLEALVSGFLSARDVERASHDLDRRGADLKRELLAGLSTTDADALTQTLSAALRDWVVARRGLELADWKSAVGYGGDRLGLLLAGDLSAALNVVRQATGSSSSARRALRELVLFSISGPYLQLRRDLSIALPDSALAPILDLG